MHTNCSTEQDLPPPLLPCASHRAPAEPLFSGFWRHSPVWDVTTRVILHGTVSPERGDSLGGVA